MFEFSTHYSLFEYLDAALLEAVVIPTWIVHHTAECSATAADNNQSSLCIEMTAIDHTFNLAAN